MSMPSLRLRCVPQFENLELSQKQDIILQKYLKINNGMRKLKVLKKNMFEDCYNERRVMKVDCLKRRKGELLTSFSFLTLQIF